MNITITADEAYLILSALEERRIEYEKFQRDARKMAQFDYMQHWAEKVDQCRDLILKVYLAHKSSGEEVQN